jgi:CRP/FNR family transcriptional regulator, nitrogen oxide reductase regulator
MLANTEIMALIKVVKPRFLEGLASSDIASIIAPATKRSIPVHSVMAHEGHPAEHLFLIVRGRARSFCMTPQGEKVPVFWFPPGDVFGGASFLSNPTEYLVSTEAVSNSTVLIWDRTTIRSLGAKYPRLVENALLIAYDYFVVYRSLHISATRHTARQRLAQVLGNLANGLGRRVTEGVELDVRNEELATEANITIFTASRLLNEWQRKGFLTKRRGKVVVHSPETLMLSEH